MGQYCFARWRLLSVVVCNTASGRARGRSGSRHCTAGQSCYVPLGRHIVLKIFSVAEFVLWNSDWSTLLN